MKIRLRHQARACVGASISAMSTVPATVARPVSLSTPLSFVAVVATLALSACGGGGGTDSPSADNNNVTPSNAASASLGAGSSTEFAWHIDTPAAVVLKDPKGNTVPANTVTCAAQDSTQVQVKADCSSIKALRVGPLAIVVTGDGGASATLTVTGIPQRTWTGVHGAGGITGGYALVTLDDGRVLAWGHNQSGVLGQNQDMGGAGTGLPDMSTLKIPAAVLDAQGTGPLRNIVQASCGDGTGLALAKDGTVWTWGNNNSLALGRKDAASLLPVQVASLNNRGVLDHVVQAEMGDHRAVALLDDGTVAAWGSWPGDGHLDSNGAPVSQSLPTKVRSPDSDEPLSNIVAVSAGWSTSAALAADGRVYTWGYDLNEGRLGAGAILPHPSPRSVHVKKADGSDLGNIVQISMGYSLTLALASDGTVWAWGGNDWGQLGQGAQRPDSPVAVQVKGPAGSTGALNNIVMVAAGGNWAQALTADGRIYAWGIGSSAQLGDGPNRTAGDIALQPVLVTDTEGAAPMRNAVSIAAGYDHAQALLADGSVVSWGSNTMDTLGRATTFEDGTPGRVELGAGAFLKLKPAAYPNLHARAR